MKKIVFTGGGTLGHVVPNQYLIQELTQNKNEQTEIFYIGSAGIEKQHMQNIVKRYYTIPAVKFERGKFFKNFKIPFVLVRAINQAKHALKEIQPDVLFSKGGYVSLPVCIAARKLRIPIVAHESDSSFGLANRIILRLCNTMCVNFEKLAHAYKKNKLASKIVYTGPIFSKQFEKRTTNTNGLNLDQNKKTILIIGGSLGSVKINQIVCHVLNDLLPEFNIIHIVGKGNLIKKSYNNYNAFEMYGDMANLYNIADFVVGRSGAGVTSECYFKQLPMLLIPLENKASRGDQLDNAKYYQQQKVAYILREAELNPNSLVSAITTLNENLTQIKSYYKTLPNPNGKKLILDMLNKF